MRLPFGLGRRSGSADGATGDGSTTGSEGSGSSASSGASAPASLPTRAWASLPAIQRTTGDMPLVASPATFVDALPGSQGLPPIVEPLGHEVSALATPGLVVARSRAVEAPAPGSIPAPAPVQRRASRTAAASGTVDAAYEAFDETPVDVAAPAPVAAQGPMPSVAAPSAPIRTMPTVSRQAIHVPDRPLTSAAAAAQPASVQRSSASAPAAPGGAPTPALPRPSGGMRRVPAPTPTPQVSRQAAENGPAPSPSPTAAAVPATTAPVIGPARRGLGEPLDAAPASARPVAAAHAGPVVSRSTTSGPLPTAASSLLPVAQRSAATPGDRPALGPGGGAPDLSRTPPAPLPQPALRLPHLPVSRSADGTSRAPATTAPAAMPAPVSQGPTIRPTTGANPLRTSLAIQRSAADDADDAEPESELPSPWWSSEPAATADVARNPMGPAAADAAPPATIQRSATVLEGRSAPATAFAPRTGAVGAAATTARPAPGAAPVQRTAAQATRPSPLPQPAGAGMRFTSSGSNGRSDAGSSVTTAAAPVGVLGQAPVVQTSPAMAAPASTSAAAPGPGPAPVVQRAEDSAPAAPVGTIGGPPSERDLDELAQALFGRIRGRLRNDLIHDREAKGLTFDNV